MNFQDEYVKIIRLFCQNQDSHIDKIQYDDCDSKIVLGFIHCLNGEFDKYLQFHNDFAKKEQSNGIEDLFVIEARIKYLSKIHFKEVFHRKSNSIQEEFIGLCNKAIEIFPFAFISSTNLSLLYEIKKQYRESLKLLMTIWDYGFQTKSLLYNIIYRSMKSNEWALVRKMDNFVLPEFNRIVTKIFIFSFRFKIFHILLFLVWLILVIWNYWKFPVLFLSIIFLFLFVYSQKMQNRLIAFPSIIVLFELLLLIIAGFLMELIIY